MAENVVPISERELLSIPSAAQLIDHSEDAVRHLVKTRQIPSVKVGTRRFVRRTDLNAWVAKLGDSGEAA